MRLTRTTLATLTTLSLAAFPPMPTAAAAEPVAKPLPAALSKKLDAELAAIVAAPGRELASLSVLAMKDGAVVYHRQFGSRWIDPAGVQHKPAGPRTMYRIASISKLITTLGVMKLVEQGRLDLDRDVSDYLGWRLRNPHFPEVPITVRMMLNHTSSLRDDGGYYWDAASRTHLKDVFTPGAKHDGEGKMWASHAAPGTYFQYANLPWGVIGTVMERVSGERFDRLMRRLILDPMNLAGGFHPADFAPADLDEVATLYRKRSLIDGKEVWDASGPWVPQVDDYATQPPVPRALPDYEIGTNGTLFGPQGNCRMSALGLARVMTMLMNGGRLDGKPILKKASVEAMLKQSWRIDKAGKRGNNDGESSFGQHLRFMNAWGLGNQHFLDISEGNAGDRLVEGGGFKAKGHLGDAWGLTAAMAFDARSKSGLIFLTGGPAFDPETHRGRYSAFYRHEEQIMTALHRRAILRR
jgi:CubicO group peptidase (beta-lactamase class C family)